MLSYNDHQCSVVPWERSRKKFQRFILLEVVAHPTFARFWKDVVTNSHFSPFVILNED